MRRQCEAAGKKGESGKKEILHEAKGRKAPLIRPKEAGGYPQGDSILQYFASTTG